MPWKASDALNQRLSMLEGSAQATRDNFDSIIKRIDALEVSSQVAAPKTDDQPKKPDGNTLYCSFCGKSQHEVRKLIAGPKSISICDEDVLLCLQILVNPTKEASK